MCGIGGVVFTKSTQAQMEMADALFTALEDRGRHASGVSFVWEDADNWVTRKGAVPASELDYLATVGHLHTKAMMFHTRYTTQGSTANNRNNHPIIGHNHILTHNGVLWNDDTIFSSLGVKRNAQVDSEALNALLDAGGVEYVAEMAQGSVSLAWVDSTVTPDRINLFTNGRNPLVIARCHDDTIVYASGIHHIRSAGFHVKDHFNAIPFKQYTLHFDGRIESEYISDERKAPTVIYGGRNEHPAGSTPTKSKAGRSRGVSGPSSSTSEPIVWGGWVYDPDTDAWHKWRGQ